HLFDSWQSKKVKKEFVPTDIDIPEEEWKEQLRKFLQSPKKTALIAPSFTEARACFYFSKESGHSVPADIGILSFTTKREHSDSGVPFSGYVYSGFTLGEAAATLILERINNKGIDLPTVRIPFKKIEGKTLPKEFFA
ncbi:MAG: substrate-binding domain-containing protein, partial [Candidatus Nanoarchaeia archaeon]